jgi:ketosteroid isomerase-like protein
MTGSGAYGNPGNVATEVEIVRAIYDAFSRRDASQMTSRLAEDVVLHLQGTSRMAGRNAPYHGHAGVLEYFADVDRIWDEIELHADDVRAIAGSVVVFGHVTGRVGGEHVTRRVVWTWLLRDGRAISVRADDLGPGD